MRDCVYQSFQPLLGVVEAIDGLDVEATRLQVVLDVFDLGAYRHHLADYVLELHRYPFPGLTASQGMYLPICFVYTS